jgi:transcriptional repressor NrdR
MVVKKDGRREKFDRQKVLSGLLKACEKRPVSMPRLAEIVDEVENCRRAQTGRLALLK